MSGAAAAVVPEAFSRTLLETMARAIAPDPDFTPAAWGEAHLILPAVTTARPGPVRLALIPYAQAILDVLGPRSPYRLVVWMSSSQVAKTTVGLIWMGFNIDQRPGPLLIVQPTGNVVKRYAKQKVEPVIAASPRLRAKVRPARARDSGNTRLTKTFPHGMLHMAGANSPAELAEMAVRDEHLDEVDRFPAEVGQEGDPVEVASYRQETYGEGKTLLTSTPTTAGFSRIELALSQCDVEMEFHVPCPFCQVRQPLVFEQLRWPTGKPEETGYECVSCQKLIPHAKKRAMVRAGAWVPIRDNGKRESIGFRIWQAYSLIGKTSWARIAQKYEAAKEKPALLRAFTNLVLGRPYSEASERPDWRRLYDRRERYQIGVVPAGALVLVCGVDIQLDRAELEVVGYGRGLESWSVCYAVLEGEIARAELKAKLSALLASSFPTAWGGPAMAISCLAIDAGYSSTHVYQWARQHKQPYVGPAGSVARGVRVVAAVKGDDAWGSIIKSASKSDVGNRRRGVRVFSVAKYQAWRELYDFLRLDPPTDAEWAGGTRHPPGYCHFPEYGEEFFKQLVSPQFVIRQNRRGVAQAVWVKDPSVRAEVPDARAYARAAAALVGLERFRERDWAALERALAVPAPDLIGPLPERAPADPVSPVAPPLVAPPVTAPRDRPAVEAPPPARPVTARRFPSRWANRTRLTGW